jgi:hypothetical protein
MTCQPVRVWFGILMVAEAITLAIAATLHFDASIPLGFATIKGVHEPSAAGPELVIAAVLVLAAVPVFAGWASARRIAVGATWFAALGVILGLSITARGNGPATVPNVTYHSCLLAVLVTGLILLHRSAGTTIRSE